MAQWGHVRRGYSKQQLGSMLEDCKLVGQSSYINPLTVTAHDIAFSRLGLKTMIGHIMLRYPLTIVGYCAGWPGPRMGMALAMRKGV